MTDTLNDGWRAPVADELCELCHKPIKAGEPAQSYGGNAGAIDEEGRQRRAWVHTDCATGAMAPSAASHVPPRHHDPVVADLIARVEALESKRR